jgi:hypothetical protein
MARFLSSAWFDDLGRALAGCDTAADGLVVQQVVMDTPDGEVRYWMRIADQQATVRPGQTTHPDVTFTEDYATAAAIARGELTTQAALLAGRIRVSGNLATLAAHQDQLRGVDPLPAAVRAGTTF